MPTQSQTEFAISWTRASVFVDVVAVLRGLAGREGGRSRGFGFTWDRLVKPVQIYNPSRGLRGLGVDVTLIAVNPRISRRKRIRGADAHRRFAADVQARTVSPKLQAALDRTRLREKIYALGGPDPDWLRSSMAQSHRLRTWTSLRR